MFSFKGTLYVSRSFYIVDRPFNDEMCCTEEQRDRHPQCTVDAQSETKLQVGLEEDEDELCRKDQEREGIVTNRCRKYLKHVDLY
jgi:hypothetical protein